VALVSTGDTLAHLSRKVTIMSASHVASVSGAKRSNARNVALWAVQILLAVFFIFAASTKLLGNPQAVESFKSIGFGQWFRYLTGACELAGGIGLLIPRLSGAAALGLVGVMIGATLTNLFLLPDAAPVAIVTVLLGAVFALIARARWSQTKALADLVRH
jgi:putative oxidoreductase